MDIIGLGKLIAGTLLVAGGGCLWAFTGAGEAGAAMIFVPTRSPEEMRFVGERLGAPLMIFAPQDGFANFPMTKSELAGLGFRLACSSGSAFAAMHKAIRQSYAALANDEIDPFLGEGGAAAEMKKAHAVTGLDHLLEIEKRTMGLE